MGYEDFPVHHGLSGDWFKHACSEGVSFPPADGTTLATLARIHISRKEWPEACQIMKAGMAISAIAIGTYAFTGQTPMLDFVGDKAASLPSLPSKDICELCVLWARSQR